MRGIVASLILCLSASLPATAQERYTIPWFENNAAERLEALRICRNDYRKVQNPETGPICSNAETAQTRIYSAHQRSAFAYMDRPAYWTENREMRQAALVACARRAAFDRQFLRYCDVVQTAERQAMRR